MGQRLNIDPLPVALRLWQHTRADGEFTRSAESTTQMYAAKTTDMSAQDRAGPSRDAPPIPRALLECRRARGRMTSFREMNVTRRSRSALATWTRTIMTIGGLVLLYPTIVVFGLKGVVAICITEVVVYRQYLRLLEAAREMFRFKIISPFLELLRLLPKRLTCTGRCHH